MGVPVPSKAPVWDVTIPKPFRSLRDQGYGDRVKVKQLYRGAKGRQGTALTDFWVRENDQRDEVSFMGKDLSVGLKGVLWFLALLWPNIAFALLCSFIAETMPSPPIPFIDETVADLQKIHGFVGTILGFTIGFRTSAAYERYYEGRRLLSRIMESSRSITRDIYSFLLKPDQEDQEGEVALICEDVRRKLNVLFAFIRQSVRESVLGFCPTSGLDDLPFDSQTFVLDPTNPQLVDLLTPEERDRYATMAPRTRPGAVCVEINMLLQLLALRFQFSDAFLGQAQAQLHNILEAHTSMIRIRDTPMPYPYVIILAVATFLFVYATPFIYSAGPQACSFLVFAYYGILQIGKSIENPYAYDTFDIDMEAFAGTLEKDMLSTSEALGRDRRAFLGEYFGRTAVSESDRNVQALIEEIEANADRIAP